MTYFQYTSPRTVSYYGESLEDLNLMPTTTKIGEGNYPHALAPEGSYAFILESDGLSIFRLRSTGWVDVTNSSGGGGGSSTANKTQYSEMPTAFAGNVGKIVQYTGETNTSFTHGYFYECASDGAGGYEWRPLNVSTGGAGLPEGYAFASDDDIDSLFNN